jgi:hypothetical protein
MGTLTSYVCHLNEELHKVMVYQMTSGKVLSIAVQVLVATYLKGFIAGI